jgi:cobalt-zinc-cadmium efflux system protein
MGHDHSHTHGITATGRHRKRLIAVLAITLAVVVIQVVGAALSGSLALLADAGHMLSDAAGVTIALLAAWIAGRPASDQRTYGYQRAEVLAALANALILIVISVVIFTEAIRRIGSTPEVHTDIMLMAAILGAVANLVSLLILRGAHEDSLNVRGAYLEVLGDLLGSAAVIVAALVILYTGFEAADTIASVLIALMILPRAWSLLRDVVDVLLEATPKGVDMDEVERHILEAPGVREVHDLHAWTITSGMNVVSAHVVLGPDAQPGDVLDHLGRCLSDDFDIDHSTFQLETAEHVRWEAEASMTQH